MRIANMRTVHAVPLSWQTGLVLINGENGLKIEACDGGVVLRDGQARPPKSYFVPHANIVCIQVMGEEAEHDSEASERKRKRRRE